MFDDGADRTSAATPAFVDYEPRFLDELVALWREAFEFGVGVSDPHPLAEQRAHFVDDLLPTNRVTLALRDDRLAGFVAASAESVAQLHVRVAMHGQGIGSSLLELAKERSSGSLWLMLSLATSALAASTRRVASSPSSAASSRRGSSRTSDIGGGAERPLGRACSTGNA